MKETLNNQETIRRFLLGDLADTERVRLEDRFLGDAEFFASIEDAENDLVDDYLARRLNDDDLARFESYYLLLPEKRAKVAAADVLRRGAKNVPVETANETPAAAAKFRTGFWQSIQNFFVWLKPMPLAVAASVLLFVAVGVWFAIRNRQINEIAYLPTPLPATNQIVQPSMNSAQPKANANFAENTDKIEERPSPIVQTNTNVVPRETPRPAIEPKLSPSPQATPQPQTVTLALVTGLVRGGGEANKLILPKNAGQVRLTFDLLAAKNYRDIEARVETVAGAQVWRGKIRQSETRAVLNLPAKLFADEDYLLIISGADVTGSRQDFAQFYFNAERK